MKEKKHFILILKKQSKVQILKIFKIFQKVQKISDFLFIFILLQRKADEENKHFNLVLKEAKKSTNTKLLLDLFRRSRKSPIFYSSLIFYKEKQMKKKQLFHLVLKEAKKSTNTKLLLDLFRRSRKSLIFYSALFLYDEGWNNLSPKNRRIPRAETVHRSGIVKSHAWECSIAQESQNLTRGNVPPPKNCGIPAR